MNRIYRILGLVVFAAALGFILHFAANNVRALPDLDWGWHSWSLLFGAGGLAAAVPAVSSLIWLVLLRTCGYAIAARKVAAVYLVSQVGKYFPGNFGHYVGRVALAGTIGVPPAAVIYTMAIETASSVLAGIMIAVAFLSVHDKQVFPVDWTAPPAFQWAAAAVAAVSVPLALGWWIRHRRRAVRDEAPADAREQWPGAWALAAALAPSGVTFVLMGAALWVLARGLFPGWDPGLWFCTGIFSVAWIAGTLTPGPPAGLGVRDAVLIAALSQVREAETAMVVTVFLRIATTLGDVLSFGLGALAGRGLLRLRGPRT